MLGLEWFKKNHRKQEVDTLSYEKITESIGRAWRGETCKKYGAIKIGEPF